MNLNRASIFVALLIGLTVGLTPAFGFDICGDGICNANAIPFGETQLTCPQDCTTVGDADLDTIPDTTDNCPFHDNVDQDDCDEDGLGDICDSDDAVWEVVELNRECLVDVDTHFLKWTLELYTEDHYRDISACNSPDRWDVDTSPARDHDCYIVEHDTARECCIDDNFVTPTGKCEGSSGSIGLRNNDTCHR